MFNWLIMRFDHTYNVMQYYQNSHENMMHNHAKQLKLKVCVLYQYVQVNNVYRPKNILLPVQFTYMYVYTYAQYKGTMMFAYTLNITLRS